MADFLIWTRNPFSCLFSTMKSYFFCLFLGIVQISAAVSQTIYRTGSGSITFKSEAPLEIITATSTSLEGIMDVASHTFAFTVPVTSFKGFNNGLQQQHFYENYLETNKYPDATFYGKIIESVDLTVPGEYVVRAKGRLTIHGQTQERIIRVEVVSKGNVLDARTEFMVPLTDHQITVPKIVNQKIAREINVIVKATLMVAGKS